MKDLEIRKPAIFLLLLIVLAFSAPLCLAQTRDFWLKAIRQSTGQAFGNIHFVVADAKNNTTEYRVDVHMKVFDDNVIQNGIYIVDSNLSPISFDLSFKSRAKNINIEGKCSNSILNLTITDEGGKVQNQKIPFQDTFFDVILADVISKKAKEKHFEVNIFDPTGLITAGVPGSIQKLQVDITATEKDKVQATITNGITTQEYYVSQQEAAIEEIKCVEQNLRAFATTAGDAKNITSVSENSFGYQTNSVFQNVHGQGIIKAHIQLTWKNLPFDKFCFEDNRQKLTKQISDNNDHEIILEFTKAKPPSAITKVPINNKEFGMFLKDSSYIKPDDPAIWRQLVDIIGDEKNAYVVAGEIIKWTAGNIKFTLTAPLLSGPEVLEKKAGHCAHYAILFASLARAAGIPTKVVVGLVNIEANPHIWAPHMWNEVWVGEWVAVDPTRGEFITGPSHIKFAEAPTIIEIQGVPISRLENNLNLEILDFNEQQ